MLRLAQLDDGDVFLDMGSGTGKATVAAGLLYPNLSVCRGVEILDGLHRESQVCVLSVWWCSRMFKYVGGP